MLQALRSGTKSPIMKFFLFFLVAGFALWGVGDVTTGLIGGSDKAISASEEVISPREVAVEFERTRSNFFPNSSVDEVLQNGLLSDVMGALSRDVLFRAENQSLGLTDPLFSFFFLLLSLCFDAMRRYVRKRLMFAFKCYFFCLDSS